MAAQYDLVWANKITSGEVTQYSSGENANVRLNIELPLSTKTGNFNAVAWNHYFCNTATVTATLPASPTDKTIIAFTAGTSATTFTIGRNGNNINGMASNLVFATLPNSVKLIYISGSGWWETKA